MNNTALGAENKKEQTINFISEAHEKFYYEKLKAVSYTHLILDTLSRMLFIMSLSSIVIFYHLCSLLYSFKYYL